MKIIDENGMILTGEPDLSLGYLREESETIHHDAVAGVEEVWHYEFKTYSNGGQDRRTVVDVPGVDPQPAWDEEVPVMRYIRYTAEDLAAQEKARKEAQQRQEALDKLPETLAALKNENEMLKQCLLEMSETVYA